jgi:hypothetical protein
VALGQSGKIRNMVQRIEVIAIMRSFTSVHYIEETDIVLDNKRVQESYTHVHTRN